MRMDSLPHPKYLFEPVYGAQNIELSSSDLVLSDSKPTTNMEQIELSSN